MSSLFRPLLRGTARSPSAYASLGRPSTLLLARTSVMSKRFAGAAPHSGNQEGGWVFGERPLHPLTPRPKYVWQYYTVWPLLLTTFAWCATMYYGGGRMQEWARITARRRMEDEGRFPTFTPSIPAHVNFHPLNPAKSMFITGKDEKDVMPPQPF